MSYCVNCGVELDASLEQCPLCNTPVINPNEFLLSAEEGKKAAEGIRSPFPSEKGTVERIKRKDVGILVSVVVLSTAAVCGLLNLLVYNRTAWSLSIIGACVLLWVLLIPAVIYTKQSIYTSVLLDGAALAAYLFLLTFLTSSDGWFRGLGLPVVVLLTAVLEAFLFCCRKLPHSFLTVGLYTFIAVPVFCMGLEVFIDRYLREEVSLGWSAIVLTICAVIDIAIVTILSRRRLRNAVRKRLHF